MIICITGMHRSGTSLMASYFQHCGIDMGEKLVASARGNERGHFEDLGFVELHDAILKHNRSHMYTPRNALDIPALIAKQARSLLDLKRRAGGTTGWKDPRTTLFLDFWHKTGSDIRFVLLYRNPASVIDSLRSRGTDRRLFVMPWLPAHAWLRYNRDILSFHQSAGGASVLVNIDGFNKDSTRSTEALGQWLGITLSRPYDDVYHPGELKARLAGPTNPLYRAIDGLYTDRIRRIYKQLEDEALINSGGVPGNRS